MENREQQILSEIREMISSVRVQLDALEAKVAMLSQAPVVEEVEDEPIDLDIEDMLDDIPVAEAVAPVAETVVAEAVEAAVEPVVDDDLPFDDVPVVEEPVVEEPVVEEPVVEEPVLIDDVPVVLEEPVVEEEHVVEEDLPVAEILVDAAAANARTAVIDAMTAKESWRTDIPGSPVKDIRSAISLHDRIIFINGLFGEDPMLFQEVLTAINSMSSVDDVVAYLAEKRPEWDMNSDEVYRFMMAVRRRIQ